LIGCRRHILDLRHKTQCRLRASEPPPDYSRAASPASHTQKSDSPCLSSGHPGAAKIFHDTSKDHPVVSGREIALPRPRSKDFVAISNPSARQQAIRINTRTSQSPCLFRVTAQSRVAPAYAHRFRRQPLDNGNASGDRFGNDRGSGLRRKRLRCQKRNRCVSNDIVLISISHRFTFSEVFCPSGAVAMGSYDEADVDRGMFIGANRGALMIRSCAYACVPRRLDG
jgi:hypothetical protein